MKQINKPNIKRKDNKKIFYSKNYLCNLKNGGSF